MIIYALATSSLAGPACRHVNLTVTASADNIDLPPFPNDTSPTAFGKYAQSFNVSEIGTRKIEGTFNIAATYCEPSQRVKRRENTIQFLLHGLGYTKVRQSHMRLLGHADFDRNTGMESTFPTCRTQGSTRGPTTQTLGAMRLLRSTTWAMANQTTPTPSRWYNSHSKKPSLSRSPRISAPKPFLVSRYVSPLYPSSHVL